MLKMVYLSQIHMIITCSILSLLCVFFSFHNKKLGERNFIFFKHYHHKGNVLENGSEHSHVIY